MRKRDTDNRWTLFAAAVTAVGTAIVAAVTSRTTNAALAERVAVLEEQMRVLQKTLATHATTV